MQAPSCHPDLRLVPQTLCCSVPGSVEDGHQVHVWQGERGRVRGASKLPTLRPKGSCARAGVLLHVPLTWAPTAGTCCFPPCRHASPSALCGTSRRRPGCTSSRGRAQVGPPGQGWLAGVVTRPDAYAVIKQQGGRNAAETAECVALCLLGIIPSGCGSAASSSCPAAPGARRAVIDTAPFFSFHHANAFEAALPSGAPAVVLDTVANHDGVDFRCVCA